MCVGSLAALAEAWDDGATRAGRLEDGTIVTLAFVPGAQPGDHLLVHLGIPVEILDPTTAREALALRGEGGVAP
jgi:hydrogenase maturation factor